MKWFLIAFRVLSFSIFITGVLVGQQEKGADSPPHPHVGRLTIDSQNVTVLRLRPGFVSSIRLPEEVSSVVLGNPQEFRAEHSEAEPRLVFLKPLTAKSTETNALITTKSGHEIPLHLVSNGKGGNGDVDFFLDYERPYSLLVPPGDPAFIVAETRPLNSRATPPIAKSDELAVWMQQQLSNQTRVKISQWTGKELQVAVGQLNERADHMTVTFSILNKSDATIELLPPQLRLSGSLKQKGHNKIKAEPVPVDDYSMTAQRLGPGERSDGVMVFERPSFKESNEQLLLQIAQAEQVDHPVLVAISFTAPIARAQ